MTYYKALEETGSAGESTPFIEFMLEIILKTLTKVRKDNVPKNVPLKRLDKVVNLMKKDKDITVQELADKLGVSDKTVKRDIAKLKNEHRIVRAGSLKSGHWETIE